MAESEEISRVTNYHLFAKFTKKPNFAARNGGTITSALWCDTKPRAKIPPSLSAPFNLREDGELQWGECSDGMFTL